MSTVAEVAMLRHRQTCWKGPSCREVSTPDFNWAEALRTLFLLMTPGRRGKK